MEIESNKAFIRQFIKEKIAKSGQPVRIEDQDDILTTGIIDSLGIMQLVAYMEETFSIRINDEEIIPEHFESIEAISLFIGRKQDFSVTENYAR